MKSIYENEMKLEFISKSNNEAFARISVAAFAAQLDPTVEELADIKTAVSEAVTNSVIHGYEDTEGIIKLSIIVKPIPERSKFALEVYNGFLASSIFSIPFPVSEISIIIEFPIILQITFIIPSVSSYP